ncbi:acyl-CoA dehydrogenase family protein [Actinomycetospora sp. NBRC 106378]|uniref:acyl-CoA dehydrogenase family protein n=1 Tax=Actinomycetospora sp. NBRC 106378 TaxID=3032208 RepID=UPI00249FA412|nr:acyl-CoA dehydrogenase family protein [Actinomycetospora sp. NBRC 106378]GLZ55395.1 hydrolase [Actinomycetospora sp. NBRC 106378]
MFHDVGLLTLAEKAADLAGDHAAEADATRRLAPEVVEALRDAGFARHFVAAAAGGSEGSFTEFARAVMAVGAACPSAAWWASLTALSARFAAHLPAEGHAELWAEGPDALVVAGLPPMGQAAVRPGGDVRLTGRWSYVSGLDEAAWVLLCARVPVDGADPELRFFLLPRADVTVAQTWDSTGMRATGTHTVIVEDVTVPAHRSFARADLVAGHSRASTVPVHNVPFQAVGGLTFVAPAAGAGAGALAACTGSIAGKRLGPLAATALVRASGRIDAARLLVEQNAAVLDTREFTPLAMARNERNAAFAAESLAAAAGELLGAAGTGGLSQGRPLERFWRDIASATSHIALRYDTAATTTYPAALAAA